MDMIKEYSQGYSALDNMQLIMNNVTNQLGISNHDNDDRVSD
jgi:hypothetical protein